MEADATLADEPRGATATALRVGPYLACGRVALFPGVEILTATHEITGARVVLRRLLPMPSLPSEEASRRLHGFQDDARRRQGLSDPRFLRLFDFAQHPNGSAYQVFNLSDGFRSVPRDGRALPVEEWTRIAAEAGAALESLLKAGVSPQFDASGLLIGPNGAVRLVPLDFPWPLADSNSPTATRALAGWLYQMLAGATAPAGGAPPSLCQINPRVSRDHDMTIRAAMNPHAIHAVSSPGEFAGLLRDRDARRAAEASVSSSLQPPTASTTWANLGAWAVLLALSGITLGWLLALYLPRR